MLHSLPIPPLPPPTIAPLLPHRSCHCVTLLGTRDRCSLFKAPRKMCSLFAVSICSYLLHCPNAAVLLELHVCEQRAIAESKIENRFYVFNDWLISFPSRQGICHVSIRDVAQYSCILTPPGQSVLPSRKSPPLQIRDQGRQPFPLSCQSLLDVSGTLHTIQLHVTLLPEPVNA